MRAMRFHGLLFSVAMGGALVGGWAQTPTPANTPASQALPDGRKAVAAKKPVRPNPVQVIPLESAPPSPPAAPADVARQKAEDASVLEQQKQQSAQAAQITNQQVQQAQKQKENVQKEVRIQDAPGPAQTLPPVAPATPQPVPPPL